MQQRVRTTLVATALLLLSGIAGRAAETIHWRSDGLGGPDLLDLQAPLDGAGRGSSRPSGVHQRRGASPSGPDISDTALSLPGRRLHGPMARPCRYPAQ